MPRLPWPRRGSDPYHWKENVPPADPHWERAILLLVLESNCEAFPDDSLKHLVSPLCLLNVYPYLANSRHQPGAELNPVHHISQITTPKNHTPTTGTLVLLVTSSDRAATLDLLSGKHITL